MNQKKHLLPPKSPAPPRGAFTTWCPREGKGKRGVFLREEVHSLDHELLHLQETGNFLPEVPPHLLELDLPHT